MFEHPPGPPLDEGTLVARARALAGHPLGSVAARFGLPVPADLRQHKGWIGQLLETSLGATAASRAEPDFPHLGIEMKTLPVTPAGRVLQSTYVCTAPLDGGLAGTWEDSWVRRKLSRVLWVPIVGDAATAPGGRRIGTPFLWTPTAAQDAVLRADWESLAELIALGELWHLTARHGQALQIRPKGADAQQTAWARAEDGGLVLDRPRGFYLRPSFTRAVLASCLRLPG